MLRLNHISNNCITNLKRKKRIISSRTRISHNQDLTRVSKLRQFHGHLSSTFTQRRRVYASWTIQAPKSCGLNFPAGMLALALARAAAAIFQRRVYSTGVLRACAQQNEESAVDEATPRLRHVFHSSTCSSSDGWSVFLRRTSAQEFLSLSLSPSLSFSLAFSDGLFPRKN